MFPRQPIHATAAIDIHATIEELLEAVFSVGSVPISTLDKEEAYSQQTNPFSFQRGCYRRT
jgi:hypothetical protein